MTRYLSAVIPLSILLCACAGNRRNTVADFGPYHYSIQKKVVCSNGAVVSAHPLASEAGLQILRKGGNAFDAAIATQLALAVVFPEAGNIGGGGFLVASLNGGKTLAIDYRERAPADAHKDLYLDANGNAITALSLNGPLAAGVPGTVAGLFQTAKYGKLPFKELIQPAIELAEKGYTITGAEARGLNRNRESFIQNNSNRPVFVRAQEWKAGDTLIQTDLANTLKRIRDQGQKGFYEGETARLIVAEMKRGKGIISYDDLSNYQAKEREMVSFPYKGYTILTMPLPASGGVLLPQMMKMIEDRNVKAMGFQTAASVQLMTEIERRAYADRAKFLGDPDFYNVPVKTLTSDAYVKERMKDYDPSKAGVSTATQAGNVPESEQTTHLSIYDKEGNAVAVTTTLNDSYGSKTIVTGAGFILNNEMDDFSVKPGVPNMYGAIGAAANAIAPGKRMLSSMTPTIVLKDQRPYIIAGTPGGTTITTSVFQTLINLLEFDMSVEDAVNKPKFHHQWLPDQIDVEAAFPQSVRDELIKMGYRIRQRGNIGRTEVIRITADGKIEAVGDSRGDDHAAGF